MKIRTSFVSNSSSSSFMIAAKSELSKDKLKEVVEQALGVSKTSPLRYLVDEIAALLIKNDPMTVQELLLDNDSFVLKALQKGFTTFYAGSAMDDDELAERILCEIAIDYEDENLMIQKEAGY